MDVQRNQSNIWIYGSRLTAKTLSNHCEPIMQRLRARLSHQITLIRLSLEMGMTTDKRCGYRQLERSCSVLIKGLCIKLLFVIKSGCSCYHLQTVWTLVIWLSSPQNVHHLTLHYVASIGDGRHPSVITEITAEYMNSVPFPLNQEANVIASLSSCFNLMAFFSRQELKRHISSNKHLGKM